MPNLSGKGNQREIGKIPKGKGNQIQFDVTKFRSDFSIGDKTSDNSFPVVWSVVAKGQAIVLLLWWSWSAFAIAYDKDHCVELIDAMDIFNSIELIDAIDIFNSIELIDWCSMH